MGVYGCWEGGERSFHFFCLVFLIWLIQDVSEHAESIDAESLPERYVRALQKSNRQWYEYGDQNDRKNEMVERVRRKY